MNIDSVRMNSFLIMTRECITFLHSPMCSVDYPRVSCGDNIANINIQYFTTEMVMVVNTHRTLYIGFVHSVLQLCTVSLAEEKCSALSVLYGEVHSV